jgi:hypothetical protein
MRMPCGSALPPQCGPLAARCRWKHQYCRQRQRLRHRARYQGPQSHRRCAAQPFPSPPPLSMAAGTSGCGADRSAPIASSICTAIRSLMPMPRWQWRSMMPPSMECASSWSSPARAATTGHRESRPSWPTGSKAAPFATALPHCAPPTRAMAAAVLTILSCGGQRWRRCARACRYRDVTRVRPSPGARHRRKGDC